MIQAFFRWRDHKTHFLISLVVIILLTLTFWVSQQRMKEIEGDKPRIDNRNNSNLI